MKKIFGFLMLFTHMLTYSQHEIPNGDWPNLQRYAVENSRLISDQPDTKRVILMGDSITEFWKPNDENFFVRTGYINRGISGQTTPQMLLRFRQDVIELKAEVVVILAGINDIAENTGPITLDRIMGNIISMAELAKANKIKVVLCSVLPADKFWWNAKIFPADKVIALNAMIKEYANRNNVTYLDYYSPMVNGQKGMDNKWADDCVHPNAAGYKLMEPLLEKAVAQTLRK
jgi:lysophospholipase L1-like esterase